MCAVHTMKSAGHKMVRRTCAFLRASESKASTNAPPPPLREDSDEKIVHLIGSARRSAPSIRIVKV